MKRGPRKKEINTEACHGVELLVSTHPPTNISTNLSAWLGVLAAASVQNLALIVVAWSPRCMDKVMPVVGGVASLWAASKIIPVMYLCSTYSDGSPYTWMMQNVNGKGIWCNFDATFSLGFWSSTPPELTWNMDQSKRIETNKQTNK